MIKKFDSEKSNTTVILKNSYLKVLGNGNSGYRGTIEVGGSKNVVTKLMVAACMTSEKSVLERVPDIKEVKSIIDIMRLYNIDVKHDVEKHRLTIDPSHIKKLSFEIFKKYVSIKSSSRIPILFCGPLMHYFDEAYIPNVSGCAIGGRPINFHISIFKSFGIEVENHDYFMKLKRVRKNVIGQHIRLPFPSIGATEQALFFSVLNPGTSIIENVALEPEILDIIQVLQKMGAMISIGDGRKLYIKGVDKLTGFHHVIIGDRLEAASWASLALASGGEIVIKNISHIFMHSFLNKYVEAGGGFEVLYKDYRESGIRFYRKSNEIFPVSIETDVYPGYQTDWQQPMLIALTQANGISTIHEQVYEKRFDFVETLNKMGARVTLFTTCLGGSTCRYSNKDHKHSAIVVGKTNLVGVDMEIPDLRAGFSYLIAALIAKKNTLSTIRNAWILSRGYENIVEKVKSLGGNISVIK